MTEKPFPIHYLYMFLIHFYYLDSLIKIGASLEDLNGIQENDLIEIGMKQSEICFANCKFCEVPKYIINLAECTGNQQGVMCHQIYYREQTVDINESSLKRSYMLMSKPKRVKPV